MVLTSYLLEIKSIIIICIIIFHTHVTLLLYVGLLHVKCIILLLGRGCPHFGKAVNLNAVKKALRQLGSLGDCTVSILFCLGTAQTS